MDFRRVLASVLASLSVFGRESPSSATNDLSIAEARSAVQRHISETRFAPAEWGIKIVSLKSGATIYETNSHKLLKPASNGKLFTAALALQTFGPDYRIRTSALAERGPDENGLLKSDLIIYGRGDPSFSARFHDGKYTNLFAPLIESIRAAGVKRVQGDLIGDDTYFTGPPFGSSWAWDDLEYYYGAEVSALTYQDNVVDLFISPGDEGAPCRVRMKPETSYLDLVNRTLTAAGEKPGRAQISIYRPLADNRAYIFGQLPRTYGTWMDSVSVPKAALWFVTELRQALAEANIEVTGRVRSRSWPEDHADIRTLKEIAGCDSPPLSVLLEKMLKPSQNLYAQLLLLQAGVHSTRAANPALITEDLGISELRAMMRKLGVPAAEVQLDDGTGLSRSSVVTPNAIVELLLAMVRSSHADLFRDALPEAGTDGTLRRRLAPLKGNLHAKTGSLRFVNTLSGYMTDRAGEPLVFSIMLNAWPGPASGRDEIDVIPLLLARIAEKSAAPDREPETKQQN